MTTTTHSLMTKTLTDDQIRTILLSSDSHYEVGRKVGASAQVVSNVRYGLNYRKALPHLMRWRLNVACVGCHHWADGACSLGFPEPAQEGPGFARLCAAWHPADAPSRVEQQGPVKSEDLRHLLTPMVAERRPLRQISHELAEAGILTRTGRPLGTCAVRRHIARLGL